MKSKNPRCKNTACYKVEWPGREPFLSCYNCNSRLYRYSLTVKVIYHWSYIPKFLLRLKPVDDRKCQSYKMLNGN